jgi:hypothetical protein
MKRYLGYVILGQLIGRFAADYIRHGFWWALALIAGCLLVLIIVSKRQARQS